MFKNAKVGNRVWSLTNGWGTVISAYDSSSCFPIHVQFDGDDGDSDSYMACGKLYEDDLNPTLFWDEIKLDIPKKPLFKLEVDAKVLVWDKDGEEKHKRHFHSFSPNGEIVTWNEGRTSFTSKSHETTQWLKWGVYEDSAS